MRVIIYCLFICPPHLSEVTLFDEDCACKWNHVATLGLIGREVRHFYLGLKEKGTITGRLSAESNTEGITSPQAAVRCLWIT